MKRKLALVVILMSSGLFFLSLMAPTVSPPGAIGPYINGIFPDSTPGFGGSWTLEDATPNITIPSPLRIIDFPNSEDVLILSKIGEIWQVNLAAQSQRMVLDFKDRAFKLGEAGATGIALHPKFGDPLFPEKQLIFVFYRWKPEPDSWNEKGYNRLSKFSWDESTETFDLDSEEILIQQYDRSTWHNGGGMFFGEDEFLYVSLGDEGMDEFQVDSNQRIDGGLFGGIMRIDVDMDASRSHEIRRQPIHNAEPPSGWPESFSQGYFIPNDNPFLSVSGEFLEEYYALGVRSPYSLSYDRDNNRIWLADVGAGKREEIDFIEKGDNLQWPYMEGDLVSEVHDRPDEIIGNERKPFFIYDKEIGSCVIGGGVYRSEKFSYLNEKFVFADFTSNKILALNSTSIGSIPEVEVLLSDFGPVPVEVPEEAGISGIHFRPNGDILATVIGKEFTDPGKILRLQQKEVIPDPPSRLSELNVFTDLENLDVVEGIFPYQVNAPLWSDRAIKKRWMAIPNDGIFDNSSEQIKFSTFQEWQFPEGTVFIKHFELPVSLNDPSKVVKLETRFFVIGTDGIGYGLTYKWNDDQSDAILQGGNSSSDFDIYEGSTIALKQTWDFPGRDQCLSCHTENAKFVLGVKTHQLNSDMFYEDIGVVKNQLEYLSECGILNQVISDPGSYPRGYPISDESIALDIRIRSYLDANCASCHRAGGIPMISLDFRFQMPLHLQNMINLPTQSQASTHDNLIVEPGNHVDSELWIRDNSTEENKMPPIARNMVDQEYVDALAEWIDGLSDDAGEFEGVVIFPNPSSGWMLVRLGNDWQPPFNLSVIAANGISAYQESFDNLVTQLELNHLPAGMYQLNIRAGDGQEVKEQIVLQ